MKQRDRIPILDSYITTEPSRQNVVDVFKDEWSSTMPSDSGLVSTPGFATLFEDERIKWAEQALGGFKDKDLLELGPLEGGHSYMLERAGARSVIAIEANSRAFLKCLCTKEIFGLSRVHFELGDFNEYFKVIPRRFDTVIASGVLYHMTDPVASLRHIASASDQLFIWTHYYDEEICNRKPHSERFDRPYRLSLGNFEGVAARRFYGKALEWSGFCGGSEPFAIWLSKSTILDLLRSLGFTNIETSFEHQDHQNGPAFALAACKSCKS